MKPVSCQRNVIVLLLVFHLNLLNFFRSLIEIDFVSCGGYNFDLASGLTEMQKNCLTVDSTFRILDIITRLGYCISMDNFFSLPQLYNMLWDNYTDSVGTLRANRKGVPKEIACKKFKKCEIAAMYTRRLMVLKWKDKKDVLMLNTFHDDNTKEIEDQNTREK